MSDESSRKEKGDEPSSSSAPSVQASGESRPGTSLAPSESTGLSSESSSMHNSLERSSSVSEQAQCSTSSSKRQSPTLSSSPPSDSLLRPPRPEIRPDIRHASSGPPSYPWLPGPPAQFAYHPRSCNPILPLIPPYSRCRSESSSQVSHSSGLDSKYPSALHMPDLGIIRFDGLADDDEEMGGDSEDKGIRIGSVHVSWRGVSNMLSLLGLISAIIALFIIYPVELHYKYGPINSAIAANTFINGSGQAQDDIAMASLTPRDQRQLPLTTDDANIDPATPQAALMRWGKSGAEYDLAFSDERVTQGRATTRCVNHGFVEVGFVRNRERRLAYWTGEWTVIEGAEEVPSFIDKLPPNDESLLVTLHIEDPYKNGQISIDYIRIYELRTRHGHAPCDDRVPISLYLNF